MEYAHDDPDFYYFHEDYYNYIPDLPCPDYSTQGLLPVLATDDDQFYCNSTYDSVICWPTTLARHYASVACPPEYRGIALNIKGSATKYCFDNGTWQTKANYSQCLSYGDDGQEEELHNYIIRTIFYVGYTMSTVALLFALFLFTYFRSLWCIRNSIHCHLMVTFVIKNLLWMIMHNSLPQLTKNIEDQNYAGVSAWTCQLIVACFNYIQSASFFWMQVEGLYLHTMIVWAYSADKVRMWKYALFGWGGPLVTIVIWAIVKTTKDNDSCCCWLPQKHIYWDYIYITPILLILLYSIPFALNSGERAQQYLEINVVLLASIEYVLITKLRANNSIATNQYKKAAKGTVILLPLLGVIYVLFIAEPGSSPVAKRIFLYFNCILQSVQGLFVAIFYCFLHGEVRNILRNRFSRWRDQRSVVSTRNSRASFHRVDGGTSIMLGGGDGHGGPKTSLFLLRNSIVNNNDDDNQDYADEGFDVDKTDKMNMYSKDKETGENLNNNSSAGFRDNDEDGGEMEIQNTGCLSPCGLNQINSDSSTPETTFVQMDSITCGGDSYAVAENGGCSSRNRKSSCIPEERDKHVNAMNNNSGYFVNSETPNSINAEKQHMDKSNSSIDRCITPTTDYHQDQIKNI